MRTSMNFSATISVGMSLLAFGAEPASADDARFRAIYEELVEINTTLSVGSCTRAAQAMAARLTAAGIPESDTRVIVPPDFPTQGNLVAVFPGTDASADAILLLAHIDVVEANSADWERDPFTLVEEDGYFYGRGTADDKSMAAIFVDLLVRFKESDYHPARPIKIALTCGEETPYDFNGVRYLLEHHRDHIDAAFGINEGGGGRLDDRGQRIYNGVLAGEKIYQDFRLEITNPGGHSSRPVPDNAIYRLAAALSRIGAFQFPIELNATTEAFFERMADIETGQTSTDMRAILETPPEPVALARILTNPTYNAVLHTTCVATQMEAGHAPNALPQRARALVNCRILPGHTQESIRQTLVDVAADPGIGITFEDPPEQVSAPPPLTHEILAPIEAITEEMWPGIPVVPIMQAGATDARFLTPTGIPTYGVSGIFSDPATTNAHGLNERVGVQALYEGREFLERLVRAYAGGQ
jgi:acetylornithine deacetylase/succinyl-diaminopimelate desuccinylase-like protein